MLKFKSDRKANTPSCFASGKRPVACMAGAGGPSRLLTFMELVY